MYSSVWTPTAIWIKYDCHYLAKHNFLPPVSSSWRSKSPPSLAAWLSWAWQSWLEELPSTMCMCATQPPSPPSCPSSIHKQSKHAASIKLCVCGGGTHSPSSSVYSYLGYDGNDYRGYWPRCRFMLELSCLVNVLYGNCFSYKKFKKKMFTCNYFTSTKYVLEET